MARPPHQRERVSKATPKRGRPPVEDEPRSARLQVRCTPTALERWRAAADDDGRPVAEVARDLLEDWAARQLGAET